MIDGLERCKVIIALGSVGVDSVDCAAATAKGIPVTNVPDTFIEEVADHAMTLILAPSAAGRAGPLVREGAGRRAADALQVPAPDGPDAGFIAFGTSRAPWPRARGRSACACWPTIPMSRSW
jgi:D-3-phosphoglycerate dehydrogenase